MLNFPKNAFPAHVDEFLGRLSGGANHSLMVPKKLDNDGAFGGAPLAVQAMAAWARQMGGHRVQLPEELATSENERAKFAATLAGMGAMYFADELTAAERRWSRSNALRALTRHVIAMNRGDFAAAREQRQAGLVH